MAHFAAEDEEACLEDARYLMSYLPQNNLEQPPKLDTGDPHDRMDPELDTIVPDNPNKPYDMRDVVTRIVDDGDFFEVQEHFARNIIIGFSRLGSRPIGIVGNHPLSSPACSTSTRARRLPGSCASATRSTSRCSRSATCPASFPALARSGEGSSATERLLYAFTEATVPKLTIVTRKAYGGADVMNSKHMLADFNFAKPQAEVAVMGPEGAVNIIYRRDIQSSPTPDERRRS